MIEIASQLLVAQRSIAHLAEQYVDAVAPGFTHLQHAQPVSFGHELAKHAHAFTRDISVITGQALLILGQSSGVSIQVLLAFLNTAGIGLQTQVGAWGRTVLPMTTSSVLVKLPPPGRRCIGTAVM